MSESLCNRIITETINELIKRRKVIKDMDLDERIKELIKKCYMCFWWECGACDGNEEFDGCQKILTVKDEDGNKNEVYYALEKMFEADNERALAPVTQKWKGIFEARYK